MLPLQLTAQHLKYFSHLGKRGIDPVKISTLSHSSSVSASRSSKAVNLVHPYGLSAGPTDVPNDWKLPGVGVAA